MKIAILAVGKNMPKWVCEGFTDYLNRLPKDCTVKLIEIPQEKRLKNANIQKICSVEEAKIHAAIPKGASCIALDRAGKMQDTKMLAKCLQSWHDNQQSICFVIGGPEGLSDAFLKQSDAIWSLSGLTFPHPLVRILLIEQIYRAWSIMINHPYHR